MIGIDEVGRGSLAGPLLVCAVRLKKPVRNLKDSKLLTAKKRQQLAEIILNNADIGYGWVDATTIDDIGLSESLKLASGKAIQDISIKPNEKVIIDGNINFLPDLDCICIPRADNIYPEVSAASIVAKVCRDEYMVGQSNKYPGYNYEKHVGYGTKAHMQAINSLGISPIQRKSFNIAKHLKK
jgi:ribonuclease HII